MSFRSVVIAALVAGALLAAPAAEAGIFGDIFTIEATSPDGRHGSWSMPYEDGLFDADRGILDWTLPSSVLITDASNNEIATLQTATVTFIEDPVVTLNFVVSTGSATVFTVTSANLSFPGINNATGRASGAVTVTDFDGDGGLITGNFPDNDTYRAFYNDGANVPATGTTFATLTRGVSSAAFDSATSSEGFPAVGFSSTDESGGVLGTVSSMSAQWRFGLDGGSSASGTSTFVVIPEPATAILLLAGFGVLLARRR